MKLLTTGERQLLIDLSDEFPAIRDALMGKLKADNQAREVAQRFDREAEYNDWRKAEIVRRQRRQRRAVWLGPLLVIGGGLAVCRIAWLLANDDGGSWLALVACGFLTLLGAGIWIDKDNPVAYPPTIQELDQRTQLFGTANNILRGHPPA